MRRIMLILVAVVLLSSVSFAAETTDKELTPEKILEFVKKERADVKSLTATMSMITYVMNNETATKGKIFLKGEDNFRLEGKISAMGGIMNYDTLMISDGKIFWQVMIAPDGKPRQVMKFSAEMFKDMPGAEGLGGLFSQQTGSDPFETAEKTSESFDLKYTGKRELNGEEVYIIEGTIKEETASRLEKIFAMTGAKPEDSVPAALKMQISTSTGVPLKIEQKTKSGKPYMNIEYSEIKFNTGLKDELFTYTPPEGVNVMDLSKIMADAGKMRELSTEEEGEKRADINLMKFEPAPSFSVESLEGKEVSLEVLKGNVIVLNFWATWCPPCREELPIFQKVVKKYEGKDVIFMAISGESRETVKKFIEEKELNIPVYLEKERAVSGAFGVSAIPTLVLIGKGGKIEEVHIGFNPRIEEILSKEIDRLLR